MKLYQKILGLSIAGLLAAIITLVLLARFYESDTLIIIACVILFPVAFILTLFFMFKYKNMIIRKVYLWGMPFLLFLFFVSERFTFPRIIVYLLFMFMGYFVLVNLVLYFLRYDLNFIVVTFFLIIGLLLKRWHMPGAGMIMTLSSMLLCILALLVAIRSFKIKSNRYLSILTFSCSLILAGLSISFVFKIQHWTGAGPMTLIFTPIFIIATLIILLTLPGSDFLEWTREQKKILLRGLLIPWLFFLYILVTTTIIPPYNQLKPFFFLKGSNTEVYFNMKDYRIENRNGLE